MKDRIPLHYIDSLDATRPRRQPAAGAGTPIHTRSFTGRFRNLRLLGAGMLFLLYFGTAWLNWNGRQAVLFDLEKQQFFLFGSTFWPQDFILLAAMLIICAFGLFFITVLAGRVWCGYACPQSIWTWVFMRIEHITEGDRGQRIKLNASPWSAEKVLRRGAKHALWLLISLGTALAFIGYFTPIRALSRDLVSLDVTMTAAFWLAFFTAATYINAGWLREKVCRDMCPYSRFQSVMFDRDTLVVAYDVARGENRGARKKGEDHRASGLGDCVDCTICVQVCPTGIDIRNGLQLECISCGACIDACDNVMDKLGYARGLVRYASQHELDGGRTALLRPRLLGYLAMLLIMMAAFGWAMSERSLLSLDVSRDHRLYRVNTSGQIENDYILKIINKTQQPRTYRINLVEEGAFELHAPGTVQLDAGEKRDLPVRVAQIAATGTPAARSLHFQVVDRGNTSSESITKSIFLVPGRY